MWDSEKQEKTMANSSGHSNPPSWSQTQSLISHFALCAHTQANPLVFSLGVKVFFHRIHIPEEPEGKPH